MNHKNRDTINRINRRPIVKNLKYNDAEELLLSMGFSKRLGKGSHIIFKHQDYKNVVTLSAHRAGDVLKTYSILQLQKALNAIQGGS